MDYTVRIGGEAGQGLQTIGEGLARVFARCGWHVFTHQDYESRVRGGHNTYQLRFADHLISCSRDAVDVLVALDGVTLAADLSALRPEGFAVYDSVGVKEHARDERMLDIPFNDIAVRLGGDRVMSNTAAIGAVLGMLRMDLAVLDGVIGDSFAAKGDAVVEANRRVAAEGYRLAAAQCHRCRFELAECARPRMLMQGVEAIGLGAIASGLKFYSAYPMTPSTGVMLYVNGHGREYGVAVEQAEDEIAAINMALGASYAGTRAMTSTSGGGFSLMVEGLSLAGMTETPVVIGLGMRPGPATGFPTRTEQGELDFVIYAGHGEFPRVVFAPGTLAQAFFLTNKAFDLAEKYQVPAFVLFDQYLADFNCTTDPFDLSKLKYTDYRLRGEALQAVTGYKRYAYSEDGVSPLAVPGESENLVVLDSDEHDEDGHIVEDAETRVRMVNKRLLLKLPRIKEEMDPPFFYGDPEPEILLVGWGSNYGIMKEAVEERRESGLAMLHFSEVFPLPPADAFDWLGLMRSCPRTVCVENNVLGQLAMLIKRETGYEFPGSIRKFDGRPFTLESFMEEIDAHR